MASTLSELFRESFSSPTLCWYTCQATQKPWGQLFIDPFAACCVQKLLCQKSATKSVPRNIKRYYAVSFKCAVQHSQQSSRRDFLSRIFLFFSFNLRKTMHCMLEEKSGGKEKAGRKHLKGKRGVVTASLDLLGLVCFSFRKNSLIKKNLEMQCLF